MISMPSAHKSLVLFCLTIFFSTLSNSSLAQDVKSEFVERFADANLFNEIKKGGYVLYMRHGTTDNSRADQVHIENFNDCDSQRILNDEGRKLASRIGQLLRKAEIPIAEVFFGPMCRTRETAELAFQGTQIHLRSHRALASSANLTSAEKVQMLREMKQLITKPLADKTNRMLISHAPNLADLMKYFVKPEGTIVVLKPQGEQFEYVASIPPKLLEQFVK
ncbi:histidine phosphatase family protein [Undibacterium cyanobacteriorum]|uniref:Histidine phosphatase family protein n=1 Tax=Undibacterium cyanobacteriorum TaxID=3073561 RepID=A0ABY9RJ59_9BURK|nr:histidine phosphatase family protein [Undibacterium sp. 20NA77.5]WMW80700.1 histidine phosphatase family protein [Undibacterium sp. 20NA77.5]